MEIIFFNALTESSQLKAAGVIVFRVMVLVLLFLTGTPPVYLQAQEPNWGQQWERVLNSAKKEGRVTVYASRSVGDLRFVWDGFRKRFPDIKLTSAVLSSTSDMVIKVMAEQRANKYIPDVALGAPGAMYNTLYRAKALEPLRPALILPGVTDPSKWWQSKHRYVDPEGEYIFVYQSSLYGPSISYNTKLVRPEEFKSVWDVLDPKWKGKIAALLPRANYVSTALLFMYHHPQMGPKFIEELYGNMNVALFSDFRLGTDWLAKGKYPLCFLCRLRRAVEQGLPVAQINPYQIKEKPGIGAGNGSAGLVKNHPHPNASKVFINWYLSREGQIAFKRANTDSSDEDVGSLREDLPLEILPPLARRRTDIEYVDISRHDWMDYAPVRAIFERIKRRKR